MATKQQERDRLSREFHKLRKEVLDPSENDYFLRALKDYGRLKKPSRIIRALKTILDTEAKLKLVKLLCGSLIPKSHRAEIFDAFLGEDTTDTPDVVGLTSEPAFCVSLEKSTTKDPIGFSVRGGSDLGLELIVSSVDPGGLADLAGIKSGDRLVSINNVLLENKSHSQVVNLLKADWSLQIEIERPKKKLQRVINFGRSDSSSSLGGIEANLHRAILDGSDDINGFGLCIRGGDQIGVGIFVSSCSRGSVAERAGLRVGDQIFEVNGESMLPKCKLNTAVEMLTGSSTAIVTFKSCASLPRALYYFDGWGDHELKETSVMGMPSVPRSSSSTASNAGYTLQRASLLIEQKIIALERPLELTDKNGTPRKAKPESNHQQLTDRKLSQNNVVSLSINSNACSVKPPYHSDLGIEIEGGSDTSVPESGVRVRSIHFLCNCRDVLRHNDEILQVNGKSICGLTHDEAAAVLHTEAQRSNPMSVTIARDGGGDGSCASAPLPFAHGNMYEEDEDYGDDDEDESFVGDEEFKDLEETLLYSESEDVQFSDEEDV
eukprot:m.95576 g.95576  ORF g.95576 m.95576 type:complete len:549 (+) comp26831_c0_seq1:216-1862(+)